MDYNRRFWKISAGDGAKFFDDFIKNNFIAISEFGEGNLLNYKNDLELKNKILTLTSKEHPFVSYYSMRFAKDLEIGETVIVYNNQTILSIGIVISTYYYQIDNIGKQSYSKGLPHRRNVKWIYSKPLKDSNLAKLGTIQDTFYELMDDRRDAVVKLLKSKNLKI